MSIENPVRFGKQSNFSPIIPKDEDGNPWLYIDHETGYFQLEEDPFWQLAYSGTGDGLRSPYEAIQERPKGRELTPQFIQGQYDGLRSYVLEHALSQPVRFGMVANLRSDGIHYRFGQKTENSFLRETFESESPLSKYIKLRKYFRERLGFEPTPEQLWYFSRDTEVFRQLVSDEVFYGTALGLEFAEDLGLLEIEKALAELIPGQIVVQFSPGNQELRKTDINTNWTRIYWTEEGEDGNIIVHTTQIKDYLSEQAYRKIYELFAGKNEINRFTAHIVSSPLVLDMSLDDFLSEIGQNLDPEYMATFEETMEFCGNFNGQWIDMPKLLRENVAMLDDNSFTLRQIEHHRKKIQAIAIKINKAKVKEYRRRKEEGGEEISLQTERRLYWQSETYNRGTGCGFSLETMSEMLNRSGQEFGDPNLPDIWICKKCGAVHHIDNNDPNTYYEKCQHCGKSGRC